MYFIDERDQGTFEVRVRETEQKVSEHPTREEAEHWINTRRGMFFAIEIQTEAHRSDGVIETEGACTNHAHGIEELEAEVTKWLRYAVGHGLVITFNVVRVEAQYQLPNPNQSMFGPAGASMRAQAL